MIRYPILPSCYLFIHRCRKIDISEISSLIFHGNDKKSSQEVKREPDSKRRDQAKPARENNYRKDISKPGEKHNYQPLGIRNYRLLPGFEVDHDEGYERNDR